MCADPEACRSREERHRLEQERDALKLRAEMADRGRAAWRTAAEGIGADRDTWERACREWMARAGSAETLLRATERQRDAAGGVVSDLLGELREARDALRIQNDLALERLAEVERLRGALYVALGAMQANIAYATEKDESALARGIEAARAALTPTEKGTR